MSNSVEFLDDSQLEGVVGGAINMDVVNQYNFKFAKNSKGDIGLYGHAVFSVKDASGVTMSERRGVMSEASIRRALENGGTVTLETKSGQQVSLTPEIADKLFI